MGNVTDKLLIPLTRVFGPMPSEDGAIEYYEKALGQFDDETLDKASIEIIGTFLPSKVRPWPPVAICRKAAERMAPAPSGASEFAANLRKRNDEAVAFAHRWVSSTDQGRQSAAEGWDHEARGVVRQLYVAASRKGPVAPADIVLDDATVATYRKTYGAPSAATQARAAL